MLLGDDGTGAGDAVSASILPLHDPIRVAEQIAVLDNALPGRLWIVLGAGYRVDEFEMAGVEHAARGKILEEYVGALLQAWTGEPFEWRGPHRVRHAEAGDAAAPDGARRRWCARGRAPGRPVATADAADEHRSRVVRDAYCEEAERVGFEGGFVIVPDGPDLRARRRRPGPGVGRDRAVRAVRGADLRVVPDAGSALDAGRRRRDRRRPEARRRSSWWVRRNRSWPGCERARADGSVTLPPARRRPAARPRVGEPGAVRGRGAAAPPRAR